MANVMACQGMFKGRRKLQQSDTLAQITHSSSPSTGAHPCKPLRNLLRKTSDPARS